MPKKQTGWAGKQAEHKHTTTAIHTGNSADGRKAIRTQKREKVKIVRRKKRGRKKEEERAKSERDERTNGESAGKNMTRIYSVQWNRAINQITVFLS